MQNQMEDYRRIEKAIQFLAENYHQQPSLDEVARNVNLSEYHFQRLFRRWAGISPKRFVQFLTLEYAKQALEESRSVLEATYGAGLSSPSRLHDLFVNVESMTPGEFKMQGAGLKINYGFHPSPFGECLLTVTKRGICGLGFVNEGNRTQAIEDFKRRWPAAEFQEDPTRTRTFIERIFGPRKSNGTRPVQLLLMGTQFQIKVWEALLRIPPGSVACYSDLARQLGKPLASRAVGSAVGRNPISFLIPCHRAIRKMGITGDYHWGATRKKAILAWEAARNSGESEKTSVART
jgi:AraC family transcriptional regulator of adaptative response/methylated-DNA-[protein]-cysteine methyltransferase